MLHPPDCNATVKLVAWQTRQILISTRLSIPLLSDGLCRDHFGNIKLSDICSGVGFTVAPTMLCVVNPQSD